MSDFYRPGRKPYVLVMRAADVEPGLRYPGTTESKCYTCKETVLIAGKTRERVAAGMDLICNQCFVTDDKFRRGEVVIEPQAAKEAIEYFERVKKESRN